MLDASDSTLRLRPVDLTALRLRYLLPITAVAVLLGTVAPEVWRLAIFAMAAIGIAVAAGPQALFALMVVTSGVSFSQVTDGEKSMLASLGGINIDGLRLLTVLAGFTAISLAAPRILGALRFQPIYLLFLFFAATSVAWSDSQLEGARLATKLAYPLIGYSLAYHVCMTRSSALIPSFLAAAALVATVVGLGIGLVTGEWTSMEGSFRYRGSLGFSTYGLFCSMTALCAYAFWGSARSRPHLVLFLVMATQLVATGTRVALICLAAGLLAFDLGRRRFGRVAAVVLVGVVIWNTVPTLGKRTGAIPFPGTVTDLTGVAEGVNLSGRLIVWQDVWAAMVQGGGAFGHGLGSSSTYLTGRYSGAKIAHNEYLRLWAETGPVGIALFLLAYGALLFALCRVAITSPRARELALLGICAVITFLVASVTDNTLDYYATFSLFPWVLAGAAFGLRDSTGATLVTRLQPRPTQ